MVRFAEGTVLITPREAAQQLRISTGTLANDRCRERPRIPYYKPYGNVVRYLQADVDEIIRKTRVGG